MKQSPLLEALIDAFCCLPGVGRKSAQRMSYHLLERDRLGGQTLSQALQAAMENISHCQQCRNFCESTLCTICSNTKRDQQTICVVESPADILAIESSAGFNGVYFVLMGHLSPLDGMGPESLGLPLLESRIRQQQVKEVIIATGATVEGEATAHYIQDIVEKYSLEQQNLEKAGVRVSRIAQGIPMGGELEYLDASTLARSLSERRPMGRF